MKIQNIKKQQAITFKGEPDFFKISIDSTRARDKGQSLQPFADEILPSLNSVSSKEKSTAIRLLASIGSEKELPAVMEFMAKEQDPHLKADAIYFAEKFGSKAQRKFIAPYLNSENHYLKTASIRYYASHGIPEDAKLLEPILLNAKTYHDKYESLRFFAHKGTRKQANLVKSFLLDSNENIKNLATRFFENNGTELQKKVVVEMKKIKTPAEALELFFKYCTKIFH